MTNHLPQSFYTMNPDLCRTTLTSEQLRETLLATDGQIIAHGELFDLKTRHLGAGIYEVRLGRWKVKRG
jgi:hypothetical protein